MKIESLGSEDTLGRDKTMFDDDDARKRKMVAAIGASILEEEQDNIVDDIMDEIRERAKGSIRRQLLQRLGIYSSNRDLRYPTTYLLDEELSEDPQEHLFKVIIIGDATVGKTSFVQRYIQDTFKRDYKGTVGVDFAQKIIKWSDVDSVKLQLWDIAGQERFTWMTRVYYKDAQGCIIMFDLSNRNSFHNSVKWKKDVDAKCCGPDGRPIPCVLLANKCDLGHRAVDQLEIERLYQEHDFIGWTEMSVKDNLMVTDSVRFLVDIMMEERGQRRNTPDGDAPLKLLTSSTDNKRKNKHKNKCQC